MSHVCIEEAPVVAGYEEILDRSFRNSYVESDDVWSEEPAMETAVELLMSHLPADSRVLDVGAGRGRDATALLLAGHRVDAVDLVATSDWSGIVRRWPERAALIEGDFMKVRLHGAYDGLLDNGCLHHQHPSAYPAYLQKLRAHARPGATLVVSFFTPADGGAGGLWMQHDGRLTKVFDASEAGAVLRESGWAAMETRMVPRASEHHHYLVVTARRIGD